MAYELNIAVCNFRVLLLVIIGYFYTNCSHGSEVVGNAGDSTDYLVKFGYLRPQDPKTGALRSKDEFHRAIATFQRFAGLRVTGEIDEKTIKMMNAPRCGVSDLIGTSNNARRRRKRYALQGSQWGKHELTYKIIRYTSDITREQTDEEIKKAFEVWSRHTPLKFRQLHSGRADINIAFVYGEHGDGNAFDGPKGTLAHAYFPLYGGDAHFDESETWTINSVSGTNLLQVASHEFGHSIGLAHSDVQASLMAPFYRGYDDTQPSLDLHEDDIQAVQELYGARTETTQPPPTTTSRPVTRRPAKPQPDDGDKDGDGDDARTDSPQQPGPTQHPVYRPPADGAPDICKDARIDTVTRTYDGSTYAFKGAYYWKLILFGYDPEYPRLIRDDWPGLPDDLDAAFYLKSRGTTYFFKGDQYWKFVNQRMVPNYPRSIESGYPGMPTNIDAAFQWSGNGKIYFIKGDKYWRYGQSSVEYGYPRELSKWRGIPSKIDGALQYTNKRTYFFAEQQYYKFNDRQFEVDPNYPRSTGEWWFGCTTGMEKIRAKDDDKSQWQVVTEPSNSAAPADREAALQADSPISGEMRTSASHLLSLLAALVAGFYLVVSHR